MLKRAPSKTNLHMIYVYIYITSDLGEKKNILSNCVIDHTS